ncbi:MAG: homoserine dehydrogenase [Synergistetes bacterium]|nr:homoserine dehydrogenase [Synergistota bacterium]MCX8127880.1 homoserine dehydrogenase [Synergistota bacterium]MDW8192142.1 homoserine dehydrogenase [Synergistota bacterium]
MLLAINVALIGCGNVGQGFLSLLLEKKRELESQGLRINVVAVCDKLRGSAYDPDGLNLSKVLDLASKSEISSYPGVITDLDPLSAITKTNANVVLEATWTDLKTGEPAYTHMREALSAKRHVITTNKGPVLLYLKDLQRLAEINGVEFRFEGVVLSGTPVFNLVRECLPGSEIISFRGILNGTTNYILTKMEEGMSFEEALKEAQRLGYAEADPTMDVEGWDAGAKALILANVVMGATLKLDDICCEGITDIKVEDIKSALSRSRRYKLIAKGYKEGNLVRVAVAPEEVPLSDPLANILGTLNAITFSTDTIGDVTIVGRGAGGREAGYALLSDLISLSRKMLKM